MKKVLTYLFAGVILFGTSCKKYLDINENPNQATSATPQLLLSQALVATAQVLNSYNSYGAQLGGDMANAGGYGGFGTAITYNFSSNDFSGLWTGTYDNLEDYQAILDQTDGKPEYDYFNGMARIMRAHDFQLLVDTYNDVPYTDALKGQGKLTPAYTDAKTIYKDLSEQLDRAIATIDSGATAQGLINVGTADVLFD